MCEYARRKVGCCYRMSSTSSRHEEAPAARQMARPDSSRECLGTKAGGRQSTGTRRNHGTFGVNAARKGAWMKTLLVALAVGTLAQGAMAAESACRAIESTSERLACYDTVFPPKAKTPTAVDNDASRGAYKD